MRLCPLYGLQHANGDDEMDIEGELSSEAALLQRTMHPFSHVWAWPRGLMQEILHKGQILCRIGKHSRITSNTNSA